ncbi:hypothetical protein [Cyclobacterium qasimii]|nr:hypothetical protein [Cyclobacterium qasimii]
MIRDGVISDGVIGDVVKGEGRKFLVINFKSTYFFLSCSLQGGLRQAQAPVEKSNKLRHR